MNVKRIGGLAAAAIIAATAIAVVSVRTHLTRIAANAAALPRGEAHMWGIVAGIERAEQVAG